MKLLDVLKKQLIGKSITLYADSSFKAFAPIKSFFRPHKISEVIRDIEIGALNEWDYPAPTIIFIFKEYKVEIVLNLDEEYEII